MKKQIEKIKSVTAVLKVEKNKKIEAEEYVDSISDIDDNTNPDYPYDEGKPPVVIKGENEK